MRSVFVDSSAWLAFLSASDARHGKAHAAFTRATREKRVLLTSSLVVAEVHRLVLYRADARAARSVLARMTTSRDVRVEHATMALHNAAVGLLDRFSSPTLTYTDAMSFAIMRAHRCAVALTFDRGFEAAGFTVWR